MVHIIRDVSLKDYNTFGVEAKAHALVHVRSEEDLLASLEETEMHPFVLGGGSNILLVGDIPTLVLKNEIGGIRVLNETSDDVTIELGGGVNWHTFVTWAVNRNLGGVENLALIPGSVGAAPIQNVGAYGVELKEVFQSLDAISLSDGKKQEWEPAACQFGYRMSVFKGQAKGQYCITSVRLRLMKRRYQLNTSYGDIQKILESRGVTEPGIRDVYQAVIDIRSSKLPDPAELGNSGSFFKNPEVDTATFERLKGSFPNLVFYPLENDMFKIPAGWMIDQCGWKGRRIGDAGCYEKQALVLVNFGNATGREIYNLAMQIRESVLDKFGIELETEVNVIGLGEP